MSPEKGLITRILYPLLLISIMISLLSFQNGHNWGDDFAGYLKQAETLSKGNYADLRTNMTRMDNILNYPWGYPILLSPLIHLLDAHLILLKMYTYLFFLLALLFIYQLLKKDQVLALMTVLLLSSSPYFWEFKENLLADFPNLCFTFLSLYLMREVVQGKKIILNEFVSNFLIGLAIFVSFSMRNQSIVLLPTLFVLQGVFTNRKAVLKPAVFIKLIIPYITFFALVSLLSWLIPIRSTTYTDQYTFNFQFILRTIGSNLIYYLKVWNELFDTTSVIAHFSKAFSALMICLAAIGAISSCRKENILILIFPLMCISLFLITPFYQGLRYAMPIVPFFIFFFLRGAYYLSMRVGRGYGRFGHLYLGLFLVLLSFKSIIAGAYDNYRTSRIMKGPYDADSKELFGYITKNTSPADVIEFWKPRVMLLYTGRNAVFTPTRELYLRKDLAYMVYYKYPDILNDQIPPDTAYKYKEELSPCFSNGSYLVFRTQRPVNDPPSSLIPKK